MTDSAFKKITLDELARLEALERQRRDRAARDLRRARSRAMDERTPAYGTVIPRSSEEV